MYALALFVWLGYEDTSLVFVTLLGAGAATLLAVHSLAGRRTQNWKSFALAGLIAGGLVAPIAAVMMLVKVSLHSHAHSDFTLAQVIGVLSRAPVWAGAGSLAATGLGLWWSARTKKSGN